MATKVEAARIATGPGIAVVLAAAPAARRRAGAATVGTVFHPVSDRTASRLLWLAHATTPRGALVLDAGAVTAVVDRRASLLPAGIIDGRRGLRRRRPGRPRRAPTGARRPRAGQLRRGRAAGLLGPLDPRPRRDRRHEREVVHRDDLVLL